MSRFYGVLLADARREVAEQAVTSAEADEASMRARYDEGLLVESDLLAAQVQLASFRQQRIEAEGDDAVGALAQAIAGSQATVALTGAGASAASGVPTYRGAGGSWTRYDPARYASIDVFRSDPSY